MKKILPLVLVLVFAYQNGSSVPLLGKNHDIWNDGIYDDLDIDNRFWGNSSRLPKVLNFFPVPVEEECLALDKRRKGVCMNTYECKIQGGKSSGRCALGFGVCCIFMTTCGAEVINNITYFVNPDFPDLTTSMTSCNLTVKLVDEDISQLRLDFIHFNLGQPNRRTGVCEEDIFVMSNGLNTRQNLTLCGINSGQHLYFDVDPYQNQVDISMTLSKKTALRLWEVRIIQIPFTERAPIGCLQYYTGRKGIIQTMNYADNGRHLANQDYNICMRQEEGMCSIAYEPCSENSFKIHPNNGNDLMNSEVEDGSGFGPSGRQLDDECSDKIVVPCDNEDLLMSHDTPMMGYCNLVHCGDSLCAPGEKPCKIQSSALPFIIEIHFGASTRETSPEENLGMCLSYEQPDRKSVV